MRSSRFQELASRSTVIAAGLAALITLLVAHSGGIGMAPEWVWLGLTLAILVAALRWVRVVPRRMLDRFVEAAESQTQRFDTALNNMSQGVCFFDGGRRLIVCNRRYTELYDLPAECASPGTSLETIVDHRFAVGAFPEMTPEEYLVWRDSLASTNVRNDTVVQLRNGRVIAIHHRPLPDGGWVATHEDVTARHDAEERITHLAGHDALTGLANRMRLRVHLTELGKASPPVQSAILVIDLDRFKAVNDSFGHQVGDALLCAVADRLRASVRETDLAVRLGGDEFAIVQSHCNQPEQAETLARRLVGRLAEPFEIGGHRLCIGASIGVAVLGEHDGAADEILNAADVAMYRAKEMSRERRAPALIHTDPVPAVGPSDARQRAEAPPLEAVAGNGHFVVFQPEMAATLLARRTLEAELRQAVEQGQFELFYQPITNAVTGQVIAREALLRWRHPQRGLVLPGAFMAVAEEIGLTVQLGRWILRKACTEAAGWPDGVRVAVNLSVAQFADAGLVASVAAALARSGLTPSRLELEITELMMGTGASHQAMHDLAGLGVLISLDHFGTGHSSFDHLRRFPFSRIKIDRSFVREVAGRLDGTVAPGNNLAGGGAGGSGAIVAAMVALGRDLGIATTAEGVETQAQGDILVALGCTDLQGYHLGRPVPASEILPASAPKAEPRLVSAA